MSEQKKPSKKPEGAGSFMFIHSSDSGVNAKPNKAVRSFVMKSARNKKSWSTRPKSPTAQAHQPPKDPQPTSSEDPSVAHQDEDDTSVDLLELSSSPRSPSSDSLSVSSPISWYGSESSSSSTGRKRPFDTPDTSCSSLFSEVDDLPDDAHVPKRRRISRPTLTAIVPRPLAAFQSLTIPVDADADRLLQHFIDIAAPRIVPIDTHGSLVGIAKNWVVDSIQSPAGGAFIYAALTSSMIATGVTTKDYKDSAIRQINRLLSEPLTRLSDATIAAVLILLALEEAGLANPALQGAARETSIATNEAHTRGLKLMIAHKGGLAALNDNRYLQVCLLIHSVAQCVTTFRPPYTLLLDASGQIEDYINLTGRSQHEIMSTLHPFTALFIEHELLRIISTVTVFVADLNLWYERGISHVGALELQKHASLLMYRLYEWYQRDLIQRPDRFHIIPTPDRSICLALLIFLVNAAEQNSTSSSPHLSQVVTKLHLSLHNTPLSQWSGAHELLLWTLTMGALGAKGLSKSQAKELGVAFFGQNLQLAATREFTHLPVTSAQLLQGMNPCVWIPCVFDDRAKRLWTSIGVCPPDVEELEYASSNDGEQTIDDEYALGQATTHRFFSSRQR